MSNIFSKLSHGNYNQKSIVVLLACLAINNSYAVQTAPSNDDLQKCSQIFVTNALLPGTLEQCKQDLDYFIKKKDYCALSIMALNGLGGQAANPKQALKYAKQFKNMPNDDSNPSICTGNDDSAELLISQINKVLSGASASSNKTSVCDITPDAEATASTCPDYMYADLKNKINYDISILSKKLSSNQGPAAADTLTKYMAFFNSDSTFRDMTYDLHDAAATEENIKMLQAYRDDMDNLLKHYPTGLKTKTTAADLDKQLNASYKKLINSINKIVEYSTKYPAPPKPEVIKKQVITTQRNWIEYRDSYIKFAKLYYSNKYTESDIQQTTTAYLTKRRIAELNDNAQ